MNKDKPCENLFNIARNQEFELFTSFHFKNLITVESNSIKKFKAIALTYICPSFTHISDLKKKKKNFLENLVNLGMGI